MQASHGRIDTVQGALMMANDPVIANQETILGNQNRIVANQEKILANQMKLDKVLSNQERDPALRLRLHPDGAQRR